MQLTWIDYLALFALVAGAASLIGGCPFLITRWDAFVKGIREVEEDWHGRRGR